MVRTAGRQRPNHGIMDGLCSRRDYPMSTHTSHYRYDDFKIDGFARDFGSFQIRIAHSDFGWGGFEGTMTDSQYIGSVELRQEP